MENVRTANIRAEEIKNRKFDFAVSRAVAPLKDLWQWSKPLLNKSKPAGKNEFLQDPEFVEFFANNKHWLIPYAAFCYLRDKNGTSDYDQWKTNSNYDKEAIEKFVADLKRGPPRAKVTDIDVKDLVAVRSWTEAAAEFTIEEDGENPCSEDS